MPLFYYNLPDLLKLFSRFRNSVQEFYCPQGQMHGITLRLWTGCPALVTTQAAKKPSKCRCEPGVLQPDEAIYTPIVEIAAPPKYKIGGSQRQPYEYVTLSNYSQAAKKPSKCRCEPGVLLPGEAIYTPIVEIAAPPKYKVGGSQRQPYEYVTLSKESPAP